MIFLETRDMPIFIASRWSSNDNAVFPDRLEIDDNNGNVTFHKGTVIGYRQTFISRQNIASVRIATGLFFADIIIESMGGAQVRATGFTNRDARAIMTILT